MARDTRPSFVSHDRLHEVPRRQMALYPRQGMSRTPKLTGGDSPVIAGLVQAMPLALCLWAGVLGIVGLVV